MTQRLIPPETIRAVVRHAANTAPAECCGLIMAGAHRPAVNAIAAGFDAPTASTVEKSADGRAGRTMVPETGYLLPADDAIALAEAWDAGAPGLAIYHSHPDGPAQWSAADERPARFAGRPLYPEVARLIVGCRRGVPYQVRQFEYCARRNGFRCVVEYDLRGEPLNDRRDDAGSD